MGTTYKSLADAVFNKIKDYDFLELDESVAYDIVINYINDAAVRFESCSQDLDDREDELQEFNFSLTKKNFSILVNYMVVEWLTSNYILTGSALKARMTTSDFHAINQYQNLNQLTTLRDNLLKENDQLAINNSYKKSDLFELISNSGVGKKVSLYESF